MPALHARGLLVASVYERVRICVLAARAMEGQKRAVGATWQEAAEAGEGRREEREESGRGGEERREKSGIGEKREDWERGGERFF